ASKGYNLVVGYSGSFATGAKAEASKYPKTDFLVVDADVTNGKNLGSFTITQTTWQYIDGYLAGELSKSGVVGWVGGECFTDTVHNEIGSEEGLKAENPKAKFISTYLGTWTTPAKAEQSADAMISDGADVIMGNQDTGWTGVDKAAEEHSGTKVIDEYFNDHKTAPSVIASSVLKNQAPYLLEYAKSALDGHYMAKFTNFHLTKSSGPAISKTPLIPEKDYTAALKIQKEIVNGKLKVSKKGKCTS
ncbi:MAG: BMP family ABC transporter substrate-binding protein, partial [Acidimicrobiales bacterium]